MRYSNIPSTLPVIAMCLFFMYMPDKSAHLFKNVGGYVRGIFPPGTQPLQDHQSKPLQENRMLRERVEFLEAEINRFKWLKEELHKIQDKEELSKAGGEWSAFFARRVEEIKEKNTLQAFGISARVIFRDPSFWSSHLWIDVGLEDNVRLGKSIVERNSIVALNNQLVGLVEKVEKKRSYVRLITDAQLVPSVRAVRGESSEGYVFDLAKQMLTSLRVKKGIYGDKSSSEAMIHALENFLARTPRIRGDYYLAKGELYGSSSALWRSKAPRLKGSGFNYDFADDEGEASDLRTGKRLQGNSQQNALLLQPGDLLVTSGLDGVFPPGLEVGVVTEVGLLREGETSYHLEAIPAVVNMAELGVVWVLPPWSKNSE